MSDEQNVNKERDQELERTEESPFEQLRNMFNVAVTEWRRLGKEQTKFARSSGQFFRKWLQRCRNYQPEPSIFSAT